MEFLVFYLSGRPRSLIRVQNGVMKRRLDAYKHRYNCTMPNRIHHSSWTLKEYGKDFLADCPGWRVSYTPPRTYLTYEGKTLFPTYPTGKHMRTRILPIMREAKRG